MASLRKRSDKPGAKWYATYREVGPNGVAKKVRKSTGTAEIVRDTVSAIAPGARDGSFVAATA